jgi:hypothetical protein
MFMLAALVAASAGCDGARKRETQALALALERFRLAGDADQAREAKNLEDIGVTDPDVARVKATCVDAVKATCEAIAIVAEVKPLVAKVTRGEIAKDAPEALALGPRLDRADVLLAKGKAGMPRCDEELRALQRR